MTNEQAKKMLKAKLECLKRETSGIDCNDGYNCDECELLYAQGTVGEQKEALDIAIKALEQTRWIPVSERLPEKNVEVLVTTEWDAITIGEMFSNNDWFIHEGTTNADIDDIKAWMPLPTIYQGEENG